VPPHPSRNTGIKKNHNNPQIIRALTTSKINSKVKDHSSLRVQILYKM